MTPDYGHLILLFLLHTALHFTLTYYLLSCLPQEKLSIMPTPTSLDAAKTLATTMQELVVTNTAEIYGLLISSFFFFQVWGIPMTWVLALLCGACMPSVFYATLATHGINIIGVLCNFYMSRIFLKRVITGNDRMSAHLDHFEKQLSGVRKDEVVYGLISLRMFPGSPNPLFNLIFPHISVISLTQNLLAVFIG